MSKLLHEKHDIPCPKCQAKNIYRETPYIWYSIEEDGEPHYRYGALFRCMECNGAWIDAKYHFYPLRNTDSP
ncbi:MAG: hypothetical protein NWF07_05905 [Candidatus Bathyarchaeota archaeon]|nr:hypothetical protein [Candidatus Bathyarchaeota archaeon]